MLIAVPGAADAVAVLVVAAGAENAAEQNVKALHVQEGGKGMLSLEENDPRTMKSRLHCP